MSTRTYPVTLPDVGTVDVSTADFGSGQTFVVLHGGAGPQSVLPFAERFADEHGVRVIAPTHPGFGGTERPEALSGIGTLAHLYDQLIADLDLEDVTVIGNSVGGWITAEIALRQSPRVSGIVLVDAVGLEVADHPVADFFGMTMDEVFERTFHDPAPFRFDPTTLPPAAAAIAAGNRAALAAYAGTAMTDPGLAARLSTLETPTLVLWGESDRIVDPTYGRAYADAIPLARFELLPKTGHAPQQETPDVVIEAIWNAGDPTTTA